MISGRATDLSGIKATKLSFGDGTKGSVKLSRTGRFTVHRTYKQANRAGKAYTITITFAARDRAGNLAGVRTKAKVLPEKIKRKPRKKKT